MMVLRDEAASACTTDRAPDVDGLPDRWSDLLTVAPFGTEDWWYRWSFAWTPVPLDLVVRSLDGDVPEVRETFPRVRDACAAYDAGWRHSRTTDMIQGWGSELDPYAQQP